ncbi:hypothetical protein PILCRDRAFT_813078 [Piloderma croceum F 1598]|uniref:Uncharacterized protein n=1 Tax=Piloderma croceum (strain F 1598) TaxID=765440 RepID=A0A0C3GET4_PILCF|nr:hypothetical protein PILCRDRAFT_813078 [Piloderma croceum F 1598]
MTPLTSDLQYTELLSERSQHDVMSLLIATSLSNFLGHCFPQSVRSKYPTLSRVATRVTRTTLAVSTCPHVGIPAWWQGLVVPALQLFQPIHIIDVFIHLAGCKGRGHYTSRKLARKVYSTLTLISDDPGLHHALLRTA